MDKWEYKIIELSLITSFSAEEEKGSKYTGFGEYEEKLNELGEDGWEIISVFDWVDSYPRILLKRKIQ